MALQRPQKSAAEVEHCTGLAPTALAMHVRSSGASLCPETLVWVVRKAIDLGDQQLAELVARALLGTRHDDGSMHGGHCEPIILATARDFGFADNEDARKDFRAECYERMWQKIKAATGEEPFWESRFLLALKELCIDVGRWTMVREDSLVGLADDDDADFPDEQRDPGVDDAVLARIGERRLRQLIRALPGKMAQVAWLRWIEGYQEHSDDPKERTIASLLVISDSMVRRYLRNARALLTQHAEVQAMRSDLGAR